MIIIIHDRHVEPSKIQGFFCKWWLCNYPKVSGLLCFFFLLTLPICRHLCFQFMPIKVQISNYAIKLHLSMRTFEAEKKLEHAPCHSGQFCVKLVLFPKMPFVSNNLMVLKTKYTPTYVSSKYLRTRVPIHISTSLFRKMKKSN